MPGPSIDEIIGHLPPARPGSAAWLLANRYDLLPGRDPTEPLDEVSLLDFGYECAINTSDEDDYYDLMEWLGIAQSWAVARLLEADGSDGIGWCAAALDDAWRQWRPVVGEVPTHDADLLDHLVTVATDRSSSRQQLARALGAYLTIPSKTTPPPWIGHFYGALHTLFKARLGSVGGSGTTRVIAGDCLSFCCCAPDGERRSREIAAARATNWG